jgi:hypothetical protein
MFLVLRLLLTRFFIKLPDHLFRVFFDCVLPHHELWYQKHLIFLNEKSGFKLNHLKAHQIVLPLSEAPPRQILMKSVQDP